MFKLPRHSNRLTDGWLTIQPRMRASVKIRPRMLCTILVQQMVDYSKKHNSDTLQTEILTWVAWQPGCTPSSGAHLSENGACCKLTVTVSKMAQLRPSDLTNNTYFQVFTGSFWFWRNVSSPASLCILLFFCLIQVLNSSDSQKIISLLLFTGKDLSHTGKTRTTQL